MNVALDVLREAGPITTLAIAMYVLLRQTLVAERKERQEMREAYQTVISNHLNHSTSAFGEFEVALRELTVEIRNINGKGR